MSSRVFLSIVGSTDWGDLMKTVGALVCAVTHGENAKGASNSAPHRKNLDSDRFNIRENYFLDLRPPLFFFLNDLLLLPSSTDTFSRALRAAARP